MRINIKCVLLIGAILLIKTTYAVGLLSLESEWYYGEFPARAYTEAVYYTNGSDCFKVLSVVPDQGIIARAEAPDPYSYRRGDVRIFIKGEFHNIADGDAVPKLYMRLDGTWRYETALGAISTIKAFKVLSEVEVDALRQEIIAKQESAAKAIHEARIQKFKEFAEKIKELGDLCVKNQAMRKMEIERFFSSLKLDLYDKIYVDPNFAPHINAQIVKDVRIEDLIEAQTKKDWDKCLSITYEEFLLPNAATYLGHIPYSKLPTKLYIDQDIPQKLFSALAEIYTSEENDFNGELQNGYEKLREAQEKNAWGDCLNIANDLLLSRSHPAAIDIDKSRILICYPNEHLFKIIIESLMLCEFKVNIRSNHKVTIFSPCTEVLNGDVLLSLKESSPLKKEESLSWEFDESSRCYKEKSSRWDKAEWSISLGGEDLYICTDRAEFDMLQKGAAKKAKELTEMLENHQIRKDEFSKQIIEMSNACREHIAKYVSISKWASQEGAEQICICEAGKDNEITEDKQDGLKTTQGVEGGGRNVTKTQAISGIDANEAKSDKDKFASVWKAIQPTNPKASKEAQRISRLECGMRNATLSRIYEKYTGLSCEDLLDKYLSALDAAKKVSKVNDDGRDKVSVLEEELLELQQEKSELSAGRKTLAMPSPREMGVSKRILQLQSEIKKQKSAKRQYEKNEKKAIAEALNSVEKKFRKKFLSDLSAAMDAIINAK